MPPKGVSPRVWYSPVTSTAAPRLLSEFQDRLRQHSRFHRLHHVKIESDLESTIPFPLERTRRERNRGNASLLGMLQRTNTAHELVAIFIWHDDVRHHHVGCVQGQDRKRSARRIRSVHAHALRFEPVGEDIASVGIVLYDEDGQPLETASVARQHAMILSDHGLVDTSCRWRTPDRGIVLRSVPHRREGGSSPGTTIASTGRMNARSFQMVIDGVELHWTEQGTGSPLIVLHGLGDSQHTWAAVAAHLGRRYRVLRLDLPGCGLSARPDATYSLDWQARLAVAWLDRLGLDSYDVLGHSYGGGVALWLLLYRSKSVRKLALVAPGGLGNEVTPLLRLAAVFGGLEAAAELVIGPLTRLLLCLHGRSLPTEQRRLLCRLNARRGTARAFVRTVRDVMNWRGQTRYLLDRVHHVEQLPAVGLFWGEQDWVIPIHHGRALCGALENCSLWPLKGGHFLHWQAPRALAEAVLAFLDRSEPAAHPAALGKRRMSVRHSRLVPGALPRLVST